MADDEGAGFSDAQYMADIAARKAEVSGLISGKKKPQALVASLQNPPVGAKNKTIKDSNAEVVETVLAQVTDSEIPSLVEGLDPDSCDVLMKYVYRFMGEKNKNYPQLLKIHAKVTETAGIGSIVRALTDRKTV